MNLIPQRNTNDCLTAAISTVTGIAYEDCPQLWSISGTQWIQLLSDWCLQRGLGMVYWEVDAKWPIIDGVTVIAVGETHRSNDFYHAVVMLAKWDKDNHRTELHKVFDPAEKDYIQNVKFVLIFTTPPPG